MAFCGVGMSVCHTCNNLYSAKVTWITSLSNPVEYPSFSLKQKYLKSVKIAMGVLIPPTLLL